MRRSLAIGILAVFLHLASLSAQQTPAWGDELPPAPALPDSLFALPSVDVAVVWPAPPLNQPPAAVRAIFVNSWAFGGRRFHELIRLADRTEVNAFVVDVKDDTGYLTYRSRCRRRSRSGPIPSSGRRTRASGSGSCASTASTRSRESWSPRIRSLPSASRSGRCITWTAACGVTVSTSRGWMRSTTRSGSMRRNSPPRRCAWASPRSSTTTSAFPTNPRAASRTRSSRRAGSARPSARASTGISSSSASGPGSSASPSPSTSSA